MSADKQNSSSASSNTTNNIDGRSVADAQGQSGYGTQNVRDNGVLSNSPISISSGGGKGSAVVANITSTDFGAVNSAFGFGQNILDLAGDAFSQLLDVSQKNNEVVQHISETSTEAINKANGQVIDATDNNRYLVAAGLAVVAVVAVKVWSK